MVIFGEIQTINFETDSRYVYAKLFVMSRSSIHKMQSFSGVPNSQLTPQTIEMDFS